MCVIVVVIVVVIGDKSDLSTDADAEVNITDFFVVVSKSTA